MFLVLNTRQKPFYFEYQNLHLYCYNNKINTRFEDSQLQNAHSENRIHEKASKIANSHRSQDHDTIIPWVWSTVMPMVELPQQTVHRKQPQSAIMLTQQPMVELLQQQPTQQQPTQQQLTE